MIEKLFPQPADDNYHGHKLGKWLLIFYTVKSFIAGSMFLHMETYFRDLPHFVQLKTSPMHFALPIRLTNDSIFALY